MKMSKVLSTILILCLAFTTYVIALDEDPNEATIEVRLELDKSDVKHGQTLKLEVFVDSDLQQHDGGIINLDMPKNIFLNEPEVESIENVTFDFETGVIGISDEAEIDSETPIITITFVIDDRSLNEASGNEFTFKVLDDSYITVDGDNLAVNSEDKNFTVTIDVITATIKIIGEIVNTNNITASLTPNSTPVVLGSSSTGKINIVPIRVSTLTPSTTYTLKIEGDGFVDAIVTFNSSTDRTISVTNFYPGDVDGDNEIDINDFNRLCSYIYDDIYGDKYEVDGDFNRDGKNDSDDITLFTYGYSSALEVNK